jgi:hypothetical protein
MAVEFGELEHLGFSSSCLVVTFLIGDVGA